MQRSTSGDLPPYRRRNWRLVSIMKVVSTSVHGIFDYLVGIALLLAPNVFGFADVGGAAVFIPRLVGALTLLQAVLTRYELGLFKVLPMRTHLTFDYILSILLALSPWLFGFANQPSHVWMPHVVVGVIGFLLALMTETASRTRATGPVH
jgi:hypothetical protein